MSTAGQKALKKPMVGRGGGGAQDQAGKNRSLHPYQARKPLTARAELLRFRVPGIPESLLELFDKNRGIRADTIYYQR